MQCKHISNAQIAVEPTAQIQQAAMTVYGCGIKSNSLIGAEAVVVLALTVAPPVAAGSAADLEISRTITRR